MYGEVTSRNQEAYSWGHLFHRNTVTYIVLRSVRLCQFNNYFTKNNSICFLKIGKIWELWFFWDHKTWQRLGVVVMDKTDHEYIRLLSEASIVFALWWTGQPHNSKVRMAQKDLRCEQWGTSRISGFCLRRHAVHATPRAVFAGYDHNGRKNMWMKAPSASCARRYVQLIRQIYIFSGSVLL